MKIAFLSPAWPAAHAQNGIATYVDIMTRALRKAGHECVVITPKLMENENESDVFQIGSVKQPIWEKAAKAIRRRISGAQVFDNKPYVRAIAETLDKASQTGPFDIVEIEESFGHSYYLQKLLNVPVVTRLHGPHFLVHQGQIEARDRQRINAEGVAIRASQAVSCPSQSVLDKVASYYDLDKPFGTAIPNPVEIAEEAMTWRLDACDQNMLLYVGRFDSIKGADIMLAAFSGLASRHADLKLVMIGKDVGIDKGYGRVQHFEDYAIANLDDDVRARIDFLGPVSHARANELRREALLSISASRFECFSYAVTEALALGCAVVAPATDGLTEYLCADEDLLFIRINDSESLEARISLLIEHPERARQLGAAGRQAAITQLSPEKVAMETLSFYQQVIADYPTEGVGAVLQ